ncbi:SGNH/GDSL hydrolase family protein [Kitasatospora sp. NBC_00315]|uniref:SGNH/GDSL hydrolase family protein n=1 Tax=Kitasatospora sp. NBC_00315 TaxID=2975963 RepID=UPI00324CA225
MHRRPRAGAAAALAGLLLAVGCTAGAGSATPPPGPSATAVRPSPSPSSPAGPYVALGDSYTSGLQLEPQVGEPKGCGRSGVDYPALVARGIALNPADLRDVSCSGARVADLTGTQRTADGANPPQLDALSAATRLVTLGIGGNDAGFMDVITVCAEQGLLRSLTGSGGSSGSPGSTGRSPAAAPCRDHYGSGGADQLRSRVDAAGRTLAGALGEIRRRAPGARVFVVGYPALLPADPSGCAQELGGVVTPGDLAFLAEKEQQLNAMLQQQATAAGAGYVDTAAPSAGHDMCAGAARWIEPPDPAPGLAAAHPNALGQQGMAAAVLAAVREG